VWVGTDDGRVQVTEDAGASWRDVTAAVARAGGPSGTWTSRVFASPYDARVAFVAKTGYRFDDFTPYVFKTTDGGESFSRITTGLPSRPINVVVQDPRNPRLLFAGTDGGLFATIDGGENWSPLRGNLPPVAIHDLVIHSRENDLVVGTYGRGIWIADITALEELSLELLDRPAHLFTPEARPRLSEEDWGNYELFGDRYVTTENEKNALMVTYWLHDSTPTLTISVRDASGKLMQELQGPKTPGLHRVPWEMIDAAKTRAPAGEYEVELKGATFSMKAKTLIRERIVR
jgi:hypothetical protein